MVRLDGSSLTVSDIAAVAAGTAGTADTPRGPGAGVVVDPSALARMQDAARAATELAGTRPVYGRSTGVGANRTVPVDPTAPDAGLALLRSHAVSAGALRAPERVRATLLVRANQLLAGGSGASPALVPALLDLLHADPLPPVRELGGLGTGDLTALATIGLALVERGVPVGPGDALPLLSSNAATLADAALAADASSGLAGVGSEVAAWVFAAVDGNAEAYSEAVEHGAATPGARYVAARMRGLTHDAPAPARLQDPFALRTVPQVHGVLFDALGRLARVVGRMVNAATENPLFGRDADGRAVLAHHGGFQAAALTAALDDVRLAALGLARLSAARLALLCDPATTTLPPFLGDPASPGASGVLALEYVVGSAVGDLQLLATPAAGVTVSVSRGVEEHASSAALAGRAALAVVPLLRTVLGAELLAALRATRLRGREVPERWQAFADAVDPDPADRDLTADLARAEAALD